RSGARWSGCRRSARVVSGKSGEAMLDRGFYRILETCYLSMVDGGVRRIPHSLWFAGGMRLRLLRCCRFGGLLRHVGIGAISIFFCPRSGLLHPPPRKRGRGTGLRSRTVEGARAGRQVSSEVASFVAEAPSTARSLSSGRPLRAGPVGAVPLPRFALGHA